MPLRGLAGDREGLRVHDGPEEHSWADPGRQAHGRVFAERARPAEGLLALVRGRGSRRGLEEPGAGERQVVPNGVAGDPRTEGHERLRDDGAFGERRPLFQHDGDLRHGAGGLGNGGREVDGLVGAGGWRLGQAEAVAEPAREEARGAAGPAVEALAGRRGGSAELERVLVQERQVRRLGRVGRDAGQREDEAEGDERGPGAGHRASWACGARASRARAAQNGHRSAS